MDFDKADEISETFMAVESEPPKLIRDFPSLDTEREIVSVEPSTSPPASRTFSQISGVTVNAAETIERSAFVRTKSESAFAPVIRPRAVSTIVFRHRFHL